MKNNNQKRPPIKISVLTRILKMLFKNYKWQMMVVTLCIVLVSMASTIAGLFMNQFIEYIEGRSTLDEAVELLKRSTRRYAKRQMTWFSANRSITWLEVGGGREFSDIADEAERLCLEHLKK